MGKIKSYKNKKEEKSNLESNNSFLDPGFKVIKWK